MLRSSAPAYCECGLPLATHPPLRNPGPLQSWHATRHLDEGVSRRVRERPLTDAAKAHMRAPVT